MFKVECPGCKAPYQVDERRVPQSGLKMRCPKCGTSFKVDSPEAPPETGGPVLGAVLGLKGNEQSRRSRAAGLKSTMLGVAAPAGLLDEPVAAKPPRPPPPRLGQQPSSSVVKPASSTAAQPPARPAPPPRR